MADIVEWLRKVHWWESDCDVRMAAAAEIERLRTVTANAKDELSRLRKAQEAHEETATKLNSYINLAGDQIDEIQKLKDVLHNCGVVEIAAHNNRVTEYMFHWEGRALDAEAEVERLRVENIQMRFALGYPMPAHLEHHVIPVNPFKCGTCDAKKRTYFVITDEIDD